MSSGLSDSTKWWYVLNQVCSIAKCIQCYFLQENTLRQHSEARGWQLFSFHYFPRWDNNKQNFSKFLYTAWIKWIWKRPDFYFISFQGDRRCIMQTCRKKSKISSYVWYAVTQPASSGGTNLHKRPGETTVLSVLIKLNREALCLRCSVLLIVKRKIN